MTSRARIGVILLQLGTPAAPSTPAVRRYLRQFLSDRRVVDLPRAQWLPILHLAVLPRRPSRSANLYRKVWTEAGSPLLVTTLAQAAALEARLASLTDDIRVVVGMRYGEPSITSAVDALVREGVDRIVALPMYPQYAGATTGSSLECLYQDLATRRVVPSVRIVPPYFADQAYIDALATVTRQSLARASAAPEHLLISFHGIPARYAAQGDPYPDHCRETARRLIESLALPDIAMSLSFQSRFGREEWLQPYTADRFQEFGASHTRLATMCPGFTADCLETIEEIGITGREQFEHAGGHAFHVVPCLNDAPAWIDAMTSIVTRELSGWV